MTIQREGFPLFHRLKVSLDKAKMGQSRSTWLLVLGLAVCVELIAQLIPGGPVRAIFALPPVLLLPGIALLSLVFARVQPNDPVLVVIFVVMLGFAVLVLDALLLNAVSIKLTTTALGLSALIITAGCVAPFVIWPARFDNAFSPNSVRSANVRVSLGAVASVVVVACSVWLVAANLPTAKSSPFTSFALASSWVHAARAPAVLTGQVITIPVVARSQSTSDQIFDLITFVDGTESSIRPIRVPRRATWRGAVRIVTPAGVGLHRVVISLSSTAPQKLPATDELVVYLDNHGA